MALLPRFHVADLDPAATAVALDADESHHLAHVLRLACADVVEVFDGRGAIRRGVVASVGKKAATIDRLEPVVASREPRIALTLAIGWLRTDHMDAVVRDATMLGVRGIQPVLTRRTTARAASRDTAHVLDRWRRIAVGALKQSGGAWLPAMSAAVPLDAWLDASRALPVRLLLVEPDVAPDATRRDVDDLADRAGAGAALVVGPEGGWDDDEVGRALGRGCQAWSLGRRVLRADAVAVAAVSALRYAWERGDAR